MNENEAKVYMLSCSYIFKHYGQESQKQQLIQECSELITAITKKDLENIIEEMADVQVLLDQFLTNPFYKKEIERVQLQKVTRQIKRIEKEKQ